MNDDNLNADEFSAYMSKYNEYLKTQGLTPEDELTFLDKPEPPNEELIIQLFITDDDIVNGADAQAIDFDVLGEPDTSRTLEGSEWSVSKFTWDTDEGKVISFEIIQMFNDEDDIEYSEFEEVEEEVEEVLYFSDRLNDAINAEDFIQAAKLRDWGKEYISVGKQMIPLIAESLEKGDIDEYTKRLDILLALRKSLNN